MGFIVAYRDAQGALCKRHVYVTGPMESIPNYDFTGQSFLQVMRYCLPLIGPVKHITAQCDGCSAQVPSFYRNI